MKMPMKGPMPMMPARGKKVGPPPFNDRAGDGSLGAAMPPRGKGATKKTGKTGGKSNAIGGGGRAAQLAAKGVPGPVIGSIARSKGVFGKMDFKKGPGK